MWVWEIIEDDWNYYYSIVPRYIKVCMILAIAGLAIQPGLIIGLLISLVI